MCFEKREGWGTGTTGVARAESERGTTLHIRPRGGLCVRVIAVSAVRVVVWGLVGPCGAEVVSRERGMVLTVGGARRVFYSESSDSVGWLGGRGT